MDIFTCNGSREDINNAPVESLVFTLLGFTLGLIILNGLATLFGSIAWLRRRMFTTRTTFSVRDKCIDTDYANLEQQAFSDAKSKAQTFMNMAAEIFSHVQSLGTNSLGFIVYLILLAVVNPLVILLSVSTTLLGVLARNWANRWRHKHDDFEAYFQKRIFHINYLGQQYGMGKDIRLYKMLDWVKVVFKENIERGYVFIRRAETRQWVADIVGGIGDFILGGIVYGYLIWQVIEGNLTVDGFVLMTAAVFGFSGWVSGVLGDMANLSNFSLRFCRIREFIAFPDVFKKEDGEDIKPEKIPYDIKVEQASLKYVGAEENTLENINLHIKPGEKLAVVGLNGASKTTLVKLLCVFYDPTEGCIKLNGKDIREFNRKSY